MRLNIQINAEVADYAEAKTMLQKLMAAMNTDAELASKPSMTITGMVTDRVTA